MSEPTDYRFTRYLLAKRSAEDRSLSGHVWDAMVEAVSQASATRPITVLEVGAGVGTMLERMVEWKFLNHARYTAIDAEPECGALMRRRVGVLSPEVHVDIETIDLRRFAERESGARTWDLIVASALLDVVDVPSSLRHLSGLLSPDGLLYLPITFDGATILQPTIDPVFDRRVEDLYHRTMDERRVAGGSSGGSRTGRSLFQHLRETGAEVLAAGSSDWVVFAGSEGYPADEAYLLHYVIHTMGKALTGRPELDAGRWASWVAERHAQIDEGTLVLIAHQLDLLARRAKPRERRTVDR